jgi:hypothetical protein
MMNDFQCHVLGNNMRKAIIDLNVRGLKLSSKWMSEQLLGLRSNFDDNQFHCCPHPLVQNSHQDIEDYSPFKTDLLSSYEYDLITFGCTLLALGEYQRCSHILRQPNLIIQNHVSGSRMKADVPQPSKSNTRLFLSIYSLYLAGEKIKDQAAVESHEDYSKSNSKSTKPESKQFETKTGKNPYLNDLFRELYPLYVNSLKNSFANSNESTEWLMDGFLLFIFGVIVRDLRKQGGGPAILHRHQDMLKEEKILHAVPSAYDLFLQSLKVYPWNW